jgi:hypothetical protein
MGSTFGTSDGLGHGEGEQASTQEKVTNGTFASDIANWATVLGAGGGTIAWDAGTIKFTQGGVSASMYAGQSISTVPGVTYTFSVSVTTNGIYTRLYVGTSLNGTELGTTSYAGSGTKTITFTASTYITYLTLVDANSATNISNWDNATCKVTTPATVLGAGGSGLIWNTAGTWATAAGVVANTPVLGVELFTDPGLEATYTAGLCDSLVVSGGSPTLAQSADVHGGAKAQQFTATARYNSIRQAMPAGARLANTWYQASLWSKRTAGAGNGVYAYLNGSDIDRPFSVITSAAYIQQTITFKINAALSYQRFALIDANDAGSYDTVIVDDFSYKLLPISTLITNQLLSTTDVLAEMVISA